MRDVRLRLVLLVGIAIISVAPQNSVHAQGVKVAFVQGGEVAVANADGTNIRVLTHGASADLQVHWSADGERLLYTASRNRENVLTDLVVLSAADGREVKRIAVNEMAPDGIAILNDMRFVADSGWVSDTLVYVAGSSHPRDPSVEMFDIRKGIVADRYNPDDYAVCPAKGHFAQVTGVDKFGKNNVEVDDKTVYATNGDDSMYQIAWNFDCTQLAFLLKAHGNDPSTNAEAKPQVVIVRPGSKEHTLLQLVSVVADLYAVGHTFIMTDSDGVLTEYNPTTRAFMPASKDVQERVAAKNKIVGTFRSLRLGTAIDIWPNILTQDSALTPK